MWVLTAEAPRTAALVQGVAAGGRRNTGGRVVGVENQGEEILVDAVGVGVGAEPERLGADTRSVLLSGR